MSKLIEKEGLYYPTKDFRLKALVNKKSIYRKAKKNPVRFWAKLAKELYWQKNGKELLFTGLLILNGLREER